MLELDRTSAWTDELHWFGSAPAWEADALGSKTKIDNQASPFPSTKITESEQLNFGAH